MNYLRSTIEQMLSERLGDYYTFTTTSAGNAGGTTVICTTLLERPGQGWVPFLLELTSGTYSGQIRPVTDFEPSTWTLTVANAFGGQVANAVTFRLHRIHPTMKTEAISESLAQLADVVPYRLNDNIVTGDCLRNGNFEFWKNSSTPYDWETVAGTVAQETTTIYQGTRALRLTGTGTVGSVRQRIQLERELNGVALTFKARVHSASASANIFIRLSQGSTNGDSGTYSGTATWVELTATLTPANANEPIYATLVNTTTGAARFDFGRMTIPDENLFDFIPVSSAYLALTEVKIAGFSTTDTNTDPGRFYNQPLPRRYERGYGWYSPGQFISNRYLELSGMGYYADLSAGTDTIDLSPSEADYFAVISALRVLHKVKGSEYLSDVAIWQRTEADLVQEESRLTRAIRRPPAVPRFAVGRG